MKKAAIRTLIAAAAGLVLLTAVGTASAATKVKFAYGSPWNPGEAFMAFGKQLGFFEEEGIDIEPVSVQGAAVMVPQLAMGHVDFGLPPPDFLVVAADKHQPYPVKMVFNYYSESPFEFVTLANSPINKLGDLKGKKLGIGALGWGNLPMTRVMLKDAGAEWQKDVTPLPVGVGPAAWTHLKNGNVDALNLFVHQHELMQAAGTKIKRIPLTEKHARMFSNGVAASDKVIKENPKLVEGMVRAIARSMAACRVYPENCARSYWKFDPATKPAADKEAEWLATYAAVNKAAQEKAARHQVNGELGMYREADWKNLIAAMHEGEQIKSTNIALDKLYTNRFIKAANNFSMKDTLDKAAKYK